MTNNKEVIKYIGRYLGRPVIATSRITCYDGDFVTFHYKRHENNKTVVEKVLATEFIKKLIIHIPEKHFKMLRYYGAVSKQKKDFIKSISNWRFLLMKSFGYDTIWCDCGRYMTVLEICHKGTPLIEKYRKFFNSS